MDTKTDVQNILSELDTLGKPLLKKRYLGQGAREPLFGVATGAMKPLVKQHMHDRALAEALYETGNYDAMYFAGVIADPKAMGEEDFDRWMEGAYFYMLSDYVVAVTLAETDMAFAQGVSDRWIDSGKDLWMSAGWSCYAWLLGSRPDAAFDTEKLHAMLLRARETVHAQPERTRHAMDLFVAAVGVSYSPLHAQALETARAIGAALEKMSAKPPSAASEIEKAAEKGKIGFKRRYVRC